MPTQKTYRFVIEISGNSPRAIKNDLIYHLNKSHLAPTNAGPYHWDAHVKEYSRVVSKRDPDSLAAISILLENTIKKLRKTADELEKSNNNEVKSSSTPRLVTTESL